VWMVVYIAPNQAVAEMMKEVLTREGILCTLRTLGIPHQGGCSHVEVLVPECEVEEAHEILTGIGV